MTPEEREKLVHRIVSGHSLFEQGGSILKIKCPTLSLLREADFYRENILDDIKYGDWLTEGQVERIVLCTINNFPIDYKDRREKLKKEIEDTKVKIYLEKFSKKKEDMLRHTIRDLERRLYSYQEPFLEYRQFTLNGYADICKSDFVVVNSVEDRDGNRVLNQDCPFSVFSKIVNFVNNSEISVSQFKELARTDPWRGYWGCCKENPFQAAVSDWTEHQRYLVMFSRMYDSVYESSECPPDRVIEDDDKLDGFFIHQRRKIQRQRAQQYTEEKSSGLGDNAKRRNPNADEVYIMAETPDEIAEIESLNDPTAMMVKRKQFDMIKHKGKVKEGDLPHRKQQIMAKAQQQFKQKFKK